MDNKDIHIKRLKAALDEARQALQWWRDTHPHHVNDADYDFDERAKAAIENRPHGQWPE